VDIALQGEGVFFKRLQASCGGLWMSNLAFHNLHSFIRNDDRLCTDLSFDNTKVQEIWKEKTGESVKNWKAILRFSDLYFLRCTFYFYTKN